MEPFSGVRLAEATLSSIDGVAGVRDTTAVPGLAVVEGVEDCSSSSTSVILRFIQVGLSPSLTRSLLVSHVYL